MKFLILLSLILASACELTEAPHSPNAKRYTSNLGDGTALNALGAGDDREELTQFVGPYSGFGMIESTTGICSSVLVGKDLVLTNAHCVTKKLLVNGNSRMALEPSQLTFYAQYSRYNFVGKSTITKIYIPDEFFRGDYSYDYALLKLETKLGEQLGFASVIAMDKKYFNRNLLKIIGYDTTHTLYETYGPVPLISGQYCKIGKIDGGFLRHNCPIGPGSSGGPMFVEENGEMKLIGIQSAKTPNQDQCSGFDPDVCYNLAISSNRFIELIKRLSI